MRALRSVLLAGLCACSDPIVLDWQYENASGSVSTPLVTDGYVAFGSEHGVTILEPDGTLRCVFDAHGEVISAPQTDGERIFFGSTNYMFYAIDGRCQLVWKFATRDRIKSDPLVAEGAVYASSYDGHLYALTAKTGDRIWTFPEEPAAEVEAEAPEEQMEEASGKAKGRARKNKGKSKGKARRKKRGAKRKALAKAEERQAAAAEAEQPQEQLPEQPSSVGDFSYSSPRLADGVIYLGNLDQHLYAIRAKDGKMLWRFKTDAPVTSTPLIVDGVVYFGSNDGNVYAVSASTQRVMWKLTTQDWVNSSPRIADGVLYIGGNDRHVYAVDPATGEARWKFSTKGPVVAIPAVHKNLVIAVGGSGDGQIYAIDRESRTLFWSFQTGGKVDSDPVIIGDRIYVTCTDHNLYVFKITRTTSAS